MIKKLHTCKIGEKLSVFQILPSEISSKLLEMGFYCGKEIEILYKAPFGDPLAVQVGDYILSMRKNEAQFIEVETKLN
ncbi:MAG: FeoA family protein [Bacteroidota bacterium]